MHRIIKFNQEPRLNSYNDMNTELRKNAKNNAVFGKPIESVRKRRDIKLVTTELRRNYLVSEPNYHATTFFSENLLAIEMRKKQIFINTSVYLALFNIGNK